jgi:hypothetical protein
MKKEKNYTRSKLGKILDERGISCSQFAEMVFEKTGYLAFVQNISNYTTGYRDIKTIKIARHFADTLGVTIEDII